MTAGISLHLKKKKKKGNAFMCLYGIAGTNVSTYSHLTGVAREAERLRCI